MISLESAQKIAEENMKEFKNYSLMKIQEYGDSYIFSFAPNDDSLPIPGLAPIVINKDSGKLTYLSIPPLDNLDILEKAKVIQKFET